MKSKYHGTKYGAAREQFDSDEELEFYCWLKEAESSGLIKNIRCHKINFKLSDRATIRFDKHMKTKINTVDKFILHPHVYSPDFDFEIISEKLNKLNFFIENERKGKFMIVDVKGGFSKSVDRFSINQKWVWTKYGLYVQKIVPFKLFLKSFVPEICRFSPKQLKPVKKYVGVPTVNEFMEID